MMRLVVLLLFSVFFQYLLAEPISSDDGNQATSDPILKDGEDDKTDGDDQDDVTVATTGNEDVDVTNSKLLRGHYGHRPYRRGYRHRHSHRRHRHRYCHGCRRRRSHHRYYYYY
uniref:Protamine-2 n=1 Tax=Schistosoma mansoni TaxID=6183 RepID=A0A5K4F633_SCHMA